MESSESENDCEFNSCLQEDKKNYIYFSDETLVDLVLGYRKY